MASTLDELAAWTGFGLCLQRTSHACDGAGSLVSGNCAGEPAQSGRALPSYVKVSGLGPGM